MKPTLRLLSVAAISFILGLSVAPDGPVLQRDVCRRGILKQRCVVGETFEQLADFSAGCPPEDQRAFPIA